VGEVLHGSLLKLLLEHCDFLNTDIIQGSVATRLRCGGIFKHELVANLLVSLPVREFWKSVNIWGSYGQEFGVLFFWDTVYNYYRSSVAGSSDRRWLQAGMRFRGRTVRRRPWCLGTPCRRRRSGQNEEPALQQTQRKYNKCQLSLTDPRDKIVL